MYAPARNKVYAGQRISVSGCQFSLYKWFPIGKLSQLGPYVGTYYTKAHYQREPKHGGFPIIRPDPLSVHPPPVVFHPDATEFSTSVLKVIEEGPCEDTQVPKDVTHDLIIVLRANQINQSI